MALAPDAKGVIRSGLFPGLRFAKRVTASLKGDLASSVAELWRGLTSAQHPAFVKRLVKAARG